LRLRLSWFDVAWAVATPFLALLLRDPDTLSTTFNGGVATYCASSSGFALLFFWAFRIRAPLPSYFATRDAVEIAKAGTAMLLATFVLTFVAHRLDGVPRSTPIIHWLLLVGGLLAARAVGKLFFVNRDLVRTPDRLEGAENIIIIGANAISAAFMQLLEACATRGSRVVGILDTRPQMAGREIGRVRILGAPHELEAVISEFDVHGVVIARVLVAGGRDTMGEAALTPLLRFCAAKGVAFDFIPAIAGMSPQPLEQSAAADAGAPGGLPSVRPALPSWLPAAAKRALDITLVAASLIVLLPMLALISVAVLITMGAPVLFWQQRQGRGGRPFQVYKFRTLRAPYTPGGRPLAPDERRSALGDFLRKSHLDELPQLFSVLRGDMSLVGPRPLLPVDQPDAISLRLSVPPGLTGWAQLNGGKLLSPGQKGVLDDWYVRHWSLRLDLAILVQTALSLLKGGSHDDFRGDAAHVPQPPGRTNAAE
jgi:lipopolysaccharide/colanic/teichoic acid biosynthesis glycosyltransferase